MKKAILIFMSIYFSLIVFMPKEQIVYTGLNKLSKQLVNFEIEDMSDFAIYEDIKGITLIYDKMRVAKIEDVKLFPFLLYNKLSVTTLESQGSFSNMLNITVLDASAVFTVFQPFKVTFTANTTIGAISGDFDIASSKLKLLLKPNNKFNSFKYKNYFKKSSKGYVYETLIR